MDEARFTPYFSKLLASIPRVNSNGKDLPLATRMWMALHRMQDDAQGAKAHITEICAG